MEVFSMYYDLEFKHYGILGMKWGVRKQPDGSKARTGSAQDNSTGYEPDNPGIGVGGKPAKIAKANVKKYRETIVERHSKSSGPISKSQYESLSGKDVKIKGRNFSRIGGKDQRLRKKTYVTDNSKDHNVYKALLDPNGKHGSKKFDMKISVANDLVSPSKKKRIEQYIKTLDQPIEYLGSSFKGRDFAAQTSQEKAMDTFTLGLETYNRFVQSQVLDTPVHSAYFDSIQKLGYNALQDDADSSIVTDTPLILFTDSANAKVTSSRALSKKEIRDAQLRLTR